MATQEVKLINGKKYIYLTYYDQESKSKKTIYCGSEEKKESKVKAIKKEIELIDKQIESYENKKQTLMTEINE